MAEIMIGKLKDTVRQQRLVASGGARTNVVNHTGCEHTGSFIEQQIQRRMVAKTSCLDSHKGLPVSRVISRDIS